MQETETSEKTLEHNRINYFLLKFDFINNEIENFTKVIKSISSRFDRLEKTDVPHFQFKVVENEQTFDKALATNWTLTSDKIGIKLRFSEAEKSITLETKKYKNNATYKPMLDVLINAIKDNSIQIESTRIGMRYINEYACLKLSDIKKVYQKRLADSIIPQLKGDKIARAIAVEEYHNDYGSLRLQYGVPNKYYPSKIKDYDLLLDIDSYVNDTIPYEKWCDAIRELNHNAYSIFSDSIINEYLQKMK